MKNNGFTLVELIAIIGLIGILSLIFIPVIDDVLDSNKEKIYSTYRKNMISASETYMLDNNIKVNVVEPVIYIDLDNLISEGLVSNSDCDGYVKVEYIDDFGSVKIERSSYLSCNDYKTEGYAD